jgi:hypothetical protein
MAFDTVRSQVILLGGLRSVALSDTWAYGRIGSYTAYGAGCPGTLGVPVLAASARPMPGSALRVDVANLPQGIAVMAMGFSDQHSGSFALPLDLASSGMPGCRLLADPAATLLLASPGHTATWTLAIPDTPSLASAVFFNQAFVFDPGFNPAGMTASNAGRALIGL